MSPLEKWDKNARHQRQKRQLYPCHTWNQWSNDFHGMVLQTCGNNDMQIWSLTWNVLQSWALVVMSLPGQTPEWDESWDSSLRPVCQYWWVSIQCLRCHQVQWHEPSSNTVDALQYSSTMNSNVCGNYSNNLPQHFWVFFYVQKHISTKKTT